MNTTAKLIVTLFLITMSGIGYSQDKPDYKLPPKSNERYLGTVSIEREYRYRIRWSETEIYIRLLKKAQEKFPTYNVFIRDFQWDCSSKRDAVGEYDYWANATGKVVYTVDPKNQWKESISAGIDKAFRNVREGSRIAIDQVSVIGGVNREEVKDQLIDVLLDKGFKVVAKEHLDKLYEEQQAQQSGIYNDKTTVQDNNFSAVGYYVNIKITETSLRVQVINVSTGEYEGNATVNF